MFTTCLHCHTELGQNDQVELFPVGRKLAFDSLKQRLWVVCTKCGRWNLSPLDERGEAIEVCEKLYHDTVLRKSTGEVGLARLPSGLELVRIGRPIFPEYADWRYGERFKRRKWISRGTTVLGIATIGALGWGLPAVTAALGFGAIGGTWAIHLWSAWQSRVQARRLVGTYYTSFDRPPEQLLGAHLHDLTVVAPSPTAWHLELPKVDLNWLEVKVHRHEHSFFGLEWGEKAQLEKVAIGDEPRLLASTISRINEGGGSNTNIKSALEFYDADRGDLFRRVGATVHDKGKKHRMKLAALPAPVRLALEIQLAEQRDTAWLDGELSVLTAAWKEAEEIAAIADSLTGAQWMDAELAAARNARELSSRTGVEWMDAEVAAARKGRAGDR
jgi:hypothetical protein